MSCELHADTIADLARDLVIHADVAAAARAHLAACAACAAQFDEQRALTADLRRLADSARDAKPSAEVKRRLLAAAHAADHADGTDHADLAALATGVSPRPRHPRLLFRAAAVVIAAAGLGWWWTREEPGTMPQPPMISTAPALPAASPTAPAVAPAPVVAAAPRRAPASRPPRSPRARPVTPPPVEDFVGVPGAAALPELESGRIVRVELPLAALPAYGVEIAATPGQTEVAADLLVGQDGLTRAIRLVQHQP